MHYSAVAALMIITTVLLSACEQKQMAVLDDKSGVYAGRSSAPSVAGFTPTYEAHYTPPAAVDSVASTDLMTAQPAPVAQPVVAAAQPAPVVSPAPVAQPLPTAITWQWPVQGTVTSGFGKQREGIANEGITIAAAQNSEIHAAADGTVAFVGNDVRDYGNMVILRHANGDMSSYAHAEHITVAKGMRVKQGDTIGYVGTSGRAKSPQLHFAIRSGDRAVDPTSKLPSQIASR